MAHIARPFWKRRLEAGDRTPEEAVTLMLVASVQPRVVGRYAIFDEIAAGGMATVHIGRLLGKAGFSRTVAVKRLHPQFARDHDFVAMFLDEARLASRIRHPNVVPVIDVIAEDDDLLLVMEYVQGESLSRLIKACRPTPVPVPVALAAMTAVLHGLHSAHEAKSEHGSSLEIVHRDVSPQNVLIGVDGVARVLDFGVAKAAHRAQTTREGQLKGKLAYMAPEQLRRDEVDRRTDIYAASVVLWEALTGQRLFDAGSEARTVMRILEERVPPPSEVRPELPKTLDALVLRGLARESNDRFKTAREMAVALENSGIAFAPSSVIGEWVESIAAAQLGARASRIAEIESRTDLMIQTPPESQRGFGAPPASPSNAILGRPETAPTLPVFPPEIAPMPVTMEPEAVGSGPGFTSTATLPSTIGAPKRRRGRALVAGLFVLVVIGAGGFYARELLRRESTAAAPPPTVTTSNAVSPIDAPPPAIVELPTASVPPAATNSAPPVATPVAVKAPAPPPKAPPPPPIKKPSTNCDPPYTVDAKGIRRIKPGCL